MTDIKISIPSLPPTGFYDEVPPISDIKHDLITSICGILKELGYQRIESSPLKSVVKQNKNQGENQGENKELAFNDITTKTTMRLREDITPQVKNLAISILKNVKRPLRLYYSGLVFGKNICSGENGLTSRMMTQLGAEIIGGKMEETIIETMITALDILKKNINGKIDEELVVALHIPDIADLLTDIFTDEKLANLLSEALLNRDIENIEKLTGDKNSDFIELARELIYAKSPSKILTKNIRSDKIKNSLKIQDKIIKDLSKNLQSLNIKTEINFDPLSGEKEDYHNEIAFVVLHRNSRSEICRGGRYYLENGESGCGFSFYIENIISAFDMVEKL